MLAPSLTLQHAPHLTQHSHLAELTRKLSSLTEAFCAACNEPRESDSERGSEAAARRDAVALELTAHLRLCQALTNHKMAPVHLFALGLLRGLTSVLAALSRTLDCFVLSPSLFKSGSDHETTHPDYLQWLRTVLKRQNTNMVPSGKVTACMHTLRLLLRLGVLCLQVAYSILSNLRRSRVERYSNHSLMQAKLSINSNPNGCLSLSCLSTLDLVQNFCILIPTPPSTHTYLYLQSLSSSTQPAQVLLNFDTSVAVCVGSVSEASALRDRSRDWSLRVLKLWLPFPSSGDSRIPTKTDTLSWQPPLLPRLLSHALSLPKHRVPAMQLLVRLLPKTLPLPATGQPIFGRAAMALGVGDMQQARTLQHRGRREVLAARARWHSHLLAHCNFGISVGETNLAILVGRLAPTRCSELQHCVLAVLERCVSLGAPLAKAVLAPLVATIKSHVQDDVQHDIETRANLTRVLALLLQLSRSSTEGRWALIDSGLTTLLLPLISPDHHIYDRALQESLAPPFALAVDLLVLNCSHARPIVLNALCALLPRQGIATVVLDRVLSALLTLAQDEAVAGQLAKIMAPAKDTTPVLFAALRCVHERLLRLCLRPRSSSTVERGSALLCVLQRVLEVANAFIVAGQPMQTVGQLLGWIEATSSHPLRQLAATLADSRTSDTLSKGEGLKSNTGHDSLATLTLLQRQLSQLIESLRYCPVLATNRVNC